jgi:hypothetical protein
LKLGNCPADSVNRKEFLQILLRKIARGVACRAYEAKTRRPNLSAVTGHRQIVHRMLSPEIDGKRHSVIFASQFPLQVDSIFNVPHRPLHDFANTVECPFQSPEGHEVPMMSKCFSWFTLSCLMVSGGFVLFAPSMVRADDQAEKKAAEMNADAAAKADAEAKATAEAKAAAEAKAGVTAKPAKPDQATLEKEFTQLMSGCVLVGKFTVVGKESQPPKEERYTITRVKKQENGKWIFVARVQYGKNDIQVPMELDVEWAGDTPVITLTDLAIPGLGTFTSRVLIYRGWYSGTWQHGPVATCLEKSKSCHLPRRSPTKKSNRRRNPRWRKWKSSPRLPLRSR